MHPVIIVHQLIKFRQLLLGGASQSIVLAHGSNINQTLTAGISHLNNYVPHKEELVQVENSAFYSAK